MTLRMGHLRARRYRPKNRSILNGAISIAVSSPVIDCGQQFARRRPQRKPMMGMAHADIKALVAWCLADDRHHVGRAGARAFPGFGIDAARRAGKSRGRPLRPGPSWIGVGAASRMANSAPVVSRMPRRHRRQHIAHLGIEHELVEHGIAFACHNACDSRA